MGLVVRKGADVGRAHFGFGLLSGLCKEGCMERTRSGLMESLMEEVAPVLVGSALKSSVRSQP